MRVDGISTIAARQMLAVFDNALPVDKLAMRMLREAGRTDAAPSPPPVSLADPATGQMAATPQTLGNVQVVVAAATLSPAAEKRRAIITKARGGLDALDRLHGEMLSGAAKASTVAALRDWLADQPDLTEDDPRLAAFYADIDLRVRVELAKFDVQA